MLDCASENSRDDLKGHDRRMTSYRMMDESCPARLSKCFMLKCGKTGHFHCLCRSTVNNVETRTRNDSEKSNSDSD